MLISLPSGLRLRPLQDRDLPAVLAIETTAYISPWSLQSFQDCLLVGYRAWVLEREGSLIGYGLMSVGADEAHILNCCIDPQQQRQGYGKRMLRHLLNLAKQEGVKTVFLDVRVSNQAAIQLYLQEGFWPIGRRKNYYVDGPTQTEDGFELALELFNDSVFPLS